MTNLHIFVVVFFPLADPLLLVYIIDELISPQWNTIYLYIFKKIIFLKTKLYFHIGHFVFSQFIYFRSMHYLLKICNVLYDCISKKSSFLKSCYTIRRPFLISLCHLTRKLSGDYWHCWLSVPMWWFINIHFNSIFTVDSDIVGFKTYSF